MKLQVKFKGGKGSGHHGHAGRKGHRGGSEPGTGTGGHSGSGGLDPRPAGTGPGDGGKEPRKRSGSGNVNDIIRSVNDALIQYNSEEQGEGEYSFQLQLQGNDIPDSDIEKFVKFSMEQDWGVSTVLEFDDFIYDEDDDTTNVTGYAFQETSE